MFQIKYLSLQRNTPSSLLTHTSGFVFLYTLRYLIIPPPCTQGLSRTWVVYDHRPVLDCKDTKYFLYLNTFAQLFSIIQKKSLNSGTNKRKKKHLENEVLVIMMEEGCVSASSCSSVLFSLEYGYTTQQERDDTHIHDAVIISPRLCVAIGDDYLTEEVTRVF